MSTAEVDPTTARNGARTDAKSSAPKRRRNTSGLKEVPDSPELREKLREFCRQTAAKLDKSAPLGKDELERIARELLERQALPEGYLGWTMVMLSSEFWRDQVAATPPSRRLFLLPHCLKHAEGCPADYDQFGLDCKHCGACSIADFRTKAEDLGYKVLVAEGSPIVMKIIVSGYVDAIVGVACLNVLEKAIDKVLLAGIPCMAVPLLSSDCRNTSVDESWVSDMIQVRQEPAAATTSTFLHLLRAARGMFERDQLSRLAPRLRQTEGLETLNGHGLDGLDPVGATEAIAHDFLARGGKYARPFITLAAYDALTGGHCTMQNGAEGAEAIPEAVRRVALSIETFHKASLVHDDIEDDDAFRYGEPTLHRRFGLSTAINVGDYLIGLGYRLVSRESGPLGHVAAAEILDLLADAHLRLSEGQGAELTWRDGGNRQLTPLDALKIYALKTAPAFEAALLCGVRCAGPLGELHQPLKQLAKHLGIAFQILNDLKDWQGDDDNKLAAGLDALGGRPTLLWALALDALDEPARNELLRAAASTELDDKARIASIERLYRQADVFEKAHQLVDKYQQRAEQVADEVEPESLRRLLGYLVETVLDRPAVAEPPLIDAQLVTP
ncbi:polyprenyl synthetase family protein [Pirellulales bacterium]|nr:polyprenyl synthetase family protein [Pirellulales bacterium]